MKKSIDFESSLLLTNKVQHSTIDSSQIVDMNSSIITKNYDKMNTSRINNINIIEDSLNNEILIQNARNHVEKVIRQIDEFRVISKEARQQRLDYKEEINAQEYEVLKQLGNVLYEFTVAYSEKRKKRLAEEYTKQQYEYMNLEQQLKREKQELLDIYPEIETSVRRLEVLQDVLGLYNPSKIDLLEQIKNE